jgi:cytochrome P450
MGFRLGVAQVGFTICRPKARLEIRIFLEQLIPRLEEVELAGPFERMRSSFLGGVKRMPIRYKLR